MRDKKMVTKMYQKNAWKKYSNFDNIMKFADDYKIFLDSAKTERLAVEEIEKLLVKSNFKKIDKFLNGLKTGDKVYFTNHSKNIIAFIIGKKPIYEGLRILASHIDSPRLDLKQNPIYEDGDLVLLDTHYYGGIKKYQWVAIPLALVGVVCKKNGEIIKINIGFEKNDPVFGINDLLIHLSSEKNNVLGEQLDVSFASIPMMNDKDNDKKDSIKKNVLKILKDKYNIEEDDFTSAEIEVVPAFLAKDYGIDRSMVSGYGQDDRSCSYCNLKAFLDTKNVDYTSCAFFVDKEEIGSVGATGASSYFIENTIIELLKYLDLLNDKNSDSFFLLRKVLSNSKIISGDVTAAADPLFKSVDAPNGNMARIGYGLCINKYTGAYGKSHANDADPEYIAYLKKILDENKINFQCNELGKVDVGGGGTIAYIFAKYNADIVDAGVPVFNMHAPMEIVSKVDLYETYLFYKAFLKSN